MLRSLWSRIYLGPGAEIKNLIHIFCSPFGGCYDEDKLNATYISIVLLCTVLNSLKCKYKALNGAGAGAENK